MPHGGHEDADLEEALHAPMPRPHCQGPWRESVGALVAVAVLILGMSVNVQPDVRTTTSLLSAAPAAAARPVAGTTTWASASPMLSVASTSPAPQLAAPSDSNVRMVGTQQRTAFNVAAQVIRPAVVGVRASFAPGVGQPALQRVGSGIVVERGGYIVTCHHVVAGASGIAVSRFREADVRRPAQLIAVRDDLALLRVREAGTWPTARFADSEKAAVGDWVLAVGHPFGLGLTVTAGIIGRRHGSLGIPGGRQYSGLLQTDAPINEGSSGGPLVNLDGHVVGLNTAIYAPTGVFSGAGFAIPSNAVRTFLAQHLPNSASGSRAAGFRGIETRRQVP